LIVPSSGEERLSREARAGAEIFEKPSGANDVRDPPRPRGPGSNSSPLARWPLAPGRAGRVATMSTSDRGRGHRLPPVRVDAESWSDVRSPRSCVTRNYRGGRGRRIHFNFATDETPSSDNRLSRNMFVVARCRQVLGARVATLSSGTRRPLRTTTTTTTERSVLGGQRSLIIFLSSDPEIHRFPPRAVNSNGKTCLSRSR